MTPERVSYQKTFNLGSYQSERIGVDMLLSPGDDPEEALKQCKAMVESFHIETIPVIENPPVVQVQQNEAEPTGDPVTTQILQCSDLTVLESFRKLAKTKTEWQTAFDEQFKKLSV